MEVPKLQFLDMGTCPSLCNDRCPVVDVLVTMQRYGGVYGVVAVMSRFRRFLEFFGLTREGVSPVLGVALTPGVRPPVVASISG